MRKRLLRHDKLRVRTPEGFMRTIGACVHHVQLPLPAMSESINDAWSRMLSNCGIIDQGDIGGLAGETDYLPERFEPLVKRWLSGLGVTRESMARLDMSPLACVGAVFHSDAHSFSEHAFAVVWLSDDAGLDLYFPQLDRRIPLSYGTAVFFDCAQLHGVVRRGATTFSREHFTEAEPTGCFVSIDLLILRPSVARPLGVRRTNARQVAKEGVKHLVGWVEGFVDDVCPTTARWTGSVSPRARPWGMV